MGYSQEDEYLLLSGIQHFCFCPRQWALIHIEQQWADDMQTLEGQYLHRHADQSLSREKRGNKLIVRGMPVKSDKLRISGVCDVVEFVRDANGVPIQGESGTYKAYPVEYKRGKPKKHDADILQLTAQAICLEEMLLCEVDVGYLYYGQTRHRQKVLLAEYKPQVEMIFQQMHEYYKRRHTPKVKTGPFCKSCSLQHICLPKLLKKQSVASYIEGRIKE